MGRSVSSSSREGSTGSLSRGGKSEATLPGNAARADSPVGLPPARILVMDDEELIRDLIVAMLGRHGFEVDVAEDAPGTISLFEEAVRAERPYAAAILDLRIPGGIGGREIVGLLKEIDNSVKVAAVSGDALDPVITNFNGHGFDASIAKPFNADQMKTLLGELGLIAAPASARKPKVRA